MSRRIWLLLAVVLLVLVSGAAVLLLYRGPVYAFELELDGPAGQQYAGSLTVDGVAEPLAGTLPARFKRTGRHFEFAAAPVSPQGEKRIKATVFLDGEQRCYCQSQGVKGGIGQQGGLFWFARGDWVGGLNADEISELIKE